ncbi:MAG: hypothetical protein AAFR23_11090, partial [Pseudomonadota bacterium]
AHAAADWPMSSRVAVHGWSHTNRSAVGAKKSEFGADRYPEEVKAELVAGHARLRELFGEYLLPVFVPPWNRIADVHLAPVHDAGFRGLSTYAGQHRATAASHGLHLANTHVDPVDWTGGRKPLPVGAVTSAFAAAISRYPTVGILSHMLGDHAVDTREALSTIADIVAASGRLRWTTPDEVFGIAQSSSGLGAIT